jgi:hypothetical protein
MCSRTQFVVAAATLGLWLAGTLSSASGQGMEVVVHSDSRVFPDIGQDVRKLKSDSAGRYYILAKPASVVWIYGPDGKRIDQIPNANSGGAVIKYAVDIDLDSSGDLFVADRGANAVEIFRPDGSLVATIPVVMPMSLAALSDGQFAIVTLRPEHLVTIMDEQGNRIRSFGDLSQFDFGGASQSLINLGKISGDPAGHIYFAIAFLPNPLIRKYDHYGSSSYSASIQNDGFEFSPQPSEDRIQFSLNFTRMSISNQLHAGLTIGSSGAVRFGGGVGMGFAGRMGRGSMGPGGLGGPGPGGMGSAEVSGQGSFRNGRFHFRLGLGLPSNGPPGRGPTGGNTSGDSGPTGVAGNSGAEPGQKSLEGYTLNFTSSGSTPDPANFTDSPDSLGIFSGSPTAMMFGGISGGMGNGLSGGPMSPMMFGGLGFQPGMFAANQGSQLLSRPSSSGELLEANGSAPPGAPGGLQGANGPDRQSGFGPPGRFGFNMATVVGTVRVNLGRARNSPTEKPVIAAIGVDPETEEVWAAIGSKVLHFDKDGNEIGSYFVAAPNGTPLHPNAILVERDRLLLASDPLGVFSLPRPDRTLTEPLLSNISGQTLRP